MDLFGLKAKKELEHEKLFHEETRNRLVNEAKKYAAKLYEAERTINIKTEKLKETIEMKDIAVKRCFEAEDLLREFLTVQIPNKKMKEKAAAFLAGE